MTNLDGLSTAQLAHLADQLRCPDGFRNPFNSGPLPRTRAKLVEYIRGMEQRRLDSEAIERQGRR